MSPKKKTISLKLAGPNQQNQIRLIGIFSIHFKLNCTIIDNFVLCAISKKNRGDANIKLIGPI